MVNSKMIKNRARLMGFTQRDIAVRLGISQSVTNQKINNVRPTRLEEAEKLAEMLKISDSEFATYFFAESSTVKRQRVRVRKKKTRLRA